MEALGPVARLAREGAAHMAPLAAAVAAVRAQREAQPQAGARGPATGSGESGVGMGVAEDDDEDAQQLVQVAGDGLLAPIARFAQAVWAEVEGEAWAAAGDGAAAESVQTAARALESFWLTVLGEFGSVLGVAVLRQQAVAGPMGRLLCTFAAAAGLAVAQGSQQTPSGTAAGGAAGQKDSSINLSDLWQRVCMKPPSSGSSSDGESDDELKAAGDMDSAESVPKLRAANAGVAILGLLSLLDTHPTAPAAGATAMHAGCGGLVDLGAAQLHVRWPQDRLGTMHLAGCLADALLVMARTHSRLPAVSDALQLVVLASQMAAGLPASQAEHIPGSHAPATRITPPAFASNPLAPFVTVQAAQLVATYGPNAVCTAAELCTVRALQGPLRSAAIQLVHSSTDAERAQAFRWVVIQCLYASQFTHAHKWLRNGCDQLLLQQQAFSRCMPAFPARRSTVVRHTYPGIVSRSV